MYITDLLETNKHMCTGVLAHSWVMYDDTKVSAKPVPSKE